MELDLPLMPSARTALTGLIDYAGLFPPSELGMAPALAEYASIRSGPYAWMVGRFVTAASRIPELRRAVGAVASPALSVVVDVSRDPHRWFEEARAALAGLANLRAHRDPSARVEALEIPLPSLPSRRDTYDAAIGQLGAMLSQAKLRDLPVYAEIPRTDRWSELVPGACVAATRARISLKVRCGGITADAFPSPEDLAAFVAAAAHEGVPFKATAGLHHPIRHVDRATGFTMHGFLNLLVGAALAAERSGRDTVVRAIDDQDAGAFAFEEDALVWRGHRFDAQTIAAAREHAFVGYGSCSVAEPVADLIAMSVLPKPA
ncbi:MAG: hypothetical protein ACLQPV_10435 [Vulcanimicrobiaceae bacterium]